MTELEAESFLVARFGPGVGAIQPVVQGEWSKAFGYRLAEREYIIRFSSLREDFDKDRLAAGYSSAALPIPRVVEVGEAPGGYYAISERAYGVYLDALDGDQMRGVLPSLFAALDAARLADVSASRGYGGWGVDGNSGHRSWPSALLDVAEDRPTDRVSGWRSRLAASAAGLGPFEVVLARFREMLDAVPSDRHLIHADLLNHNVLVSGDQLSALFDWGCSMYGDFLYDVAWLSFWSPWYPAWHGIDFAGEAARHYESIGLEVPSFERRMRCYELHIGLAHFAYNAFKNRWDDLQEVTARTLDLARRGTS